MNPASGQLTNDFVDQVSQTSLQIIANHGPKGLWAGTGFIFKVNNQLYLITNNHIVGEEYKKNEYLQINKTPLPSDSIPDNLTVKCFTNLVGYFVQNTVQIKTKQGKDLFIKFWENEGDPKTLLDVVAIPISQSQFPNSKLTGVDSSSLNSSLFMYPGQDLFVVGYPSDNGHINQLPIWKRGTIATEPNLINIGDSWFWIDATTRGGMSGSPVFFRGNIIPDKKGGIGFSTGIPTFLIGIYSAQNPNLELGVVTRFDKVYAKLKGLNP